MDEKERTVWVGNLSEKVTEPLLYELFLQAGPLEKVKIATDKDGRSKRFAFVTFKHACSVPYTIELMNGIMLYRQPLKLQNRTGSANDGMGSSQGSPYSSPHHQGSQQGNSPLARSNTWHGGDLQAMAQSLIRPNFNMNLISLNSPVWNLPNMQPQNVDPLTMQLRRERILHQQNITMDLHRQQNIQRQQNSQRQAMSNPYGRQNSRPWPQQSYRRY